MVARASSAVNPTLCNRIEARTACSNSSPGAFAASCNARTSTAASSAERPAFAKVDFIASDRPSMSPAALMAAMPKAANGADSPMLILCPTSERSLPDFFSSACAFFNDALSKLYPIRINRSPILLAIFLLFCCL